MTTDKTFSFAEFELDTAKRLLRRNGQPLALNPKAFDLLSVLVENRGQILSKDELLETVWEGQFVEENNLTVHISALRKIFGEKKGEHQFIVTIPGKGYKFVAEENPSPETSLISAYQRALPAAKNYDDGEAIIGRAAEIAEIKSVLRASKKCLLTLTGAGGSGKTKLAQTIADEMQKEFADGVFFIELAALNRAESVADAIAQAVDVKESTEKPVIDALRDFLREREILLVLDNFEQLLPAASLLKDLLESASDLKILVTSRASLRLKVEQEKVILPLDIPPRNANLSAEELTRYAAVELFAVRAQEAKPNFAVNGENAPIIAEICLKLDGLPLAIELAAVRVKLLAPSAILRRLENSLQFLTGGAKDLPSRQRTMRGAIEWSYELLDADEKFLFRRLAIFSGGLTVEATEDVVEQEKKISENYVGLSASVLDILTSLIDNSLLVQRDLAHGNVRLRMLETVREYALELLRESGEIDAVQQLHAEHFLALAEEAEPFLSGEKSIEWLEKLETEHDNLRAALRWQLEQDPEKAAIAAAALGQFWVSRSYLTEARRWLASALEKSDQRPTEARIKLLNTFSLVARHQGDYAATRRASEESLAASRATNDKPQIILSCHAVAGLETREGNFTAGRKLLEEALTISRELGDEKQIAFTLSFLGNLFLAEREPAAARAPIEESLNMFRRLGNKINVSVNLTNLGTVAYYEGDAGTARRHFTESITIAQDMGNKILVSCCLDGLAAVAAISKNARPAATLAGAAESLRTAIGYEIEITESLLRDDCLAKVRATLDEETFAALYEQGKAMSLTESVAFAKVFDPQIVSGFAEESTEIIIENHSFSRVVVVEEFEFEADTLSGNDFES